MAALSNLFSRFGFEVDGGGKADNNTRAFFSKYSGRRGPAIAAVTLTGDDETDWMAVAGAANALIAEFSAQGWIKKGFDANETAYANAIRAVTMIPAATEWGYAPTEVFQEIAAGVADYVSTQNGYSQYESEQWVLPYDDAQGAGRIGGDKSDFRRALDNLQNSLPNVRRVNLFVSWYGDDLRAGACTLMPGVTHDGSGELPHEWGCAGYTRYTARLISTSGPGAAYGGTPDDRSLAACIAELNNRGLTVAFTPFILMDVPAGNTLPDPYTGGTGQPVYPWRGRITKQYATVDKTPAVATEVAAFVAEYRAFVLHYANLLAAAGGVEIFVLGTELRGLTWLRDAAGSYPFVDALVELAADVAAILPDAKLTYAADWSEYFGHQPGDGSGDVYFHLDPLWSDANIAAGSIDNYWPTTDWRDSAPNVDADTYPEIYDYAYQMANMQGGEGYDWYYASDGDRTSQTRTPITDGGYGKPWVYRYKDLWSWWANQHYDRPGGVESGTPTAWVPQSKPIWFTEIGTPSIDKGANQPNVFYDPKSSESFIPYFSTGACDYLAQRRGNHAKLRYFDPDDVEFEESRNPESTGYTGRMLDLDYVYLYTWDARPYPFFPLFSEIWSDGGNWPFGHWLDGKLGAAIKQGSLDTMSLANTYAPRHPYIVDPATGKLDKQYRDFFEGIEFVQGDPINNVPLSPTPFECATAINALLATMRAQKRLV
jgi:hypothetical protein